MKGLRKGRRQWGSLLTAGDFGYSLLTYLAVDQMEKLLEAGILHEQGLFSWLIRQQAREPDEYEGCVVVMQAVTTMQ